MKQNMYEAKITPAVGGNAIVVSVPASDPFQAKKLIEAQYGPIKGWWSQPINVEGEGSFPERKSGTKAYHTRDAAEPFSTTTMSPIKTNGTKSIVAVVVVFVLSLLWKATKAILSEVGKFLLSATGLRR